MFIKKLNGQSNSFDFKIDFDWLLYISKTHLNYSMEEFLNSTLYEICTMWGQHCKFNGWGEEEEKEKPQQLKKKYVNIEDLPI